MHLDWKKVQQQTCFQCWKPNKEIYSIYSEFLFVGSTNIFHIWFKFPIQAIDANLRAVYESTEKAKIAEEWNVSEAMCANGCLGMFSLLQSGGL